MIDFAYDRIEDMSDAEVCTRIARLTNGMMSFWKSAQGWASVEAADLLSASMLEWQASLAESLSGWLDSTADGDLILAWANLGALVEGQLKLFLSVYYDQYKVDVDAIRKKGALVDPDGATLEPLRQFFVKAIWDSETDWNGYIAHVQQRRNAIHAFRQRDIGTFDEWREQLREHLRFVRELNERLPYPDDEFAAGEI